MSTTTPVCKNSCHSLKHYPKCPHKGCEFTRFYIDGPKGSNTLRVVFQLAPPVKELFKEECFECKCQSLLGLNESRPCLAFNCRLRNQDIMDLPFADICLNVNNMYDSFLKNPKASEWFLFREYIYEKIRNSIE